MRSVFFLLFLLLLFLFLLFLLLLFLISRIIFVNILGFGLAGLVQIIRERTVSRLTLRPRALRAALAPAIRDVGAQAAFLSLRLLTAAAWWYNVVFSSDQGVKITKIGPRKVAFYSG
jgi:hypothetical protein